MLDRNQRRHFLKEQILLRQGNADAALAFLLQKILEKYCINHNRFDYLMQRYLQDPKNACPQNIRDMSSMRGNLKRELLKDTVSWKVFFKGLVFLQIYSFQMTVELDHPGGKKTLHSVQVLNIRTIKNPGELLSNLYHCILDSLGLVGEAFTIFFNNKTRGEDAAYRGNARKELFRNIMSWNAFCRGVWFLNVNKMTLKIDIFNNGTIMSSHNVSMKAPEALVQLTVKKA